ncbi:hypothetical protein E2C01_023453 [Portunus trituberculatus]|uniref:Uncharacterized protein n=1 Tax=Portunus trituberculatus TaxID=210409 RepID=A0A5B7E883_PORTR|nr:hypothetical protein [Portunus trituberculatus]
MKGGGRRWCRVSSVGEANVFVRYLRTPMTSHVLRVTWTSRRRGDEGEAENKDGNTSEDKEEEEEEK